MEKINKKTIELINAWGPYNHGHWDGLGVQITNEEGLSGRADFLVKKIKEIILKNFTIPQIKKMSIADIGCYDGWILHQLSALPFKKIVGIEPRTRNIQKGEKIRELLNIRTRVKFQKGDIDSLSKREPFDIVLCLGLLYHLESIPLAIKKLDLITNKILILESIVLPSAHITEGFKKDIEMKDLIYQEKKLCGLTGERYESSYYDGSTARTGIVSIPTTESLMMYLDILGYSPIKVIAGPKDFQKEMKENKRQFKEILLLAAKSKINKKNILSHFAKNYEAGLFNTVINPAYIEFLYQYFVCKKKGKSLPKPVKIIINYIKSPKNDLAVIKRFFKDKYSFEIIKNLQFNTEDKLRLELGKNLYFARRYQDAIKPLEEITQKINSDWRAAYRAFYILSLIHQKIGDSNKGQYYKKLCKTCNINFPLI